MSEIEILVASLVKYQSKSYTMIEIGTALNELRCKSHYTDRQLERFLDDLSGQLKCRQDIFHPTDSIVACADRFRKQLQHADA